MDPVSAETAFAAISVHLTAEPGVDEGTRFGKNPGLRVGGKIFAMIVRGGFVAKLPAARCSELVDAGTGTPFAIGTKVMREWIVVPLEHRETWPGLADEALDFVRQ